MFDQVWRVLTPTGTVWLNLGDSYATGNRRTRSRVIDAGAGGGSVVDGLAAKNLNGVPWRVAFALQRSGWWLRNAIIWAKPNPMPESVTDRLTASYELLFLLTRSQRYFFDLNPVRVPLARPEAADGSRLVGGARKSAAGGVGASARRRGVSRYGAAEDRGKHDGDGQRPKATGSNLVPVGHAHTAAHARGRNPGDVWTIATRPYHGAHVAPFPIDLPLRAIAAGCPAGGTVLDPFSGAATTGLAALQLGRRYLGIDVNAAFHDEAWQRLRPYLPPACGAALSGARARRRAHQELDLHRRLRAGQPRQARPLTPATTQTLHEATAAARWPPLVSKPPWKGSNPLVSSTSSPPGRRTVGRHRARPRRHRAAIAVAVFVATVVAANVLTAAYGLIPVGFGLTATAGTAAAGATLLARDWVHDTAGRAAVLVCITAVALLSAGLAGPRLALASATAFGLSELADLAVYQRLRRRGLVRAVLASNAVGAPLDTIVFLTVAGLPVWTALPGQLWVKTLATVIPVAVVCAARAVPRAVLRHRLRPDGS